MWTTPAGGDEEGAGGVLGEVPLAEDPPASRLAQLPGALCLRPLDAADPLLVVAAVGTPTARKARRMVVAGMCGPRSWGGALPLITPAARRLFPGRADLAGRPAVCRFPAGRPPGYSTPPGRPLTRSRRCRRSCAASSTSLWRHSAARYAQAMSPLRWIAAEVAVDERVPGLGLLVGALGEPEVPAA